MLRSWHAALHILPGSLLIGVDYATPLCEYMLCLACALPAGLAPTTVRTYVGWPAVHHAGTRRSPASADTVVLIDVVSKAPSCITK